MNQTSATIPSLAHHGLSEDVLEFVPNQLHREVGYPRQDMDTPKCKLPEPDDQQGTECQVKDAIEPTM